MYPSGVVATDQVYGAFETLSDPAQQRRLLFELGMNFATTEKENASRAAFLSLDVP